MCNTVYGELINNNINRDVQEECANRLYRECTIHTYAVSYIKKYFTYFKTFYRVNA